MVEKENIKPDFGRFLEEYQLFIWKLCNRYADGDPDVGLDYVQEITTLLWLAYHKLRPGSSPRQTRKWISYIARDYFRTCSERKKPDIVTFSDLKTPLNVALDDDNSVELRYESMECLNPSERRVVELFVEGYKPGEIAQTLGISANAARLRLHRAVEHMKEYVNNIVKDE